MGLPEAWTVCPPSWMAENELCGAEIVVQEHDYAWGQPLALGKAELLRHLDGLRIEECITQGTLFGQYREMQQLTEGMEYLGRPVRVVELPVGSTHGIFTKAAELRGIEQLCVDLHEDPAFASDLLQAMCRIAVERIRAWRRLCGLPDTLPLEHGWGLADDSLTLISRGTYETHVLPHHEWLYSTMTRGTRHIHLCGHVQHLFRVLREGLGITLFDGPGTQVDIPQMIDDVGTDVVIQAQVSHAFLRSSPEVLRAAVAHVLDDRAKRRVKMRLLDYATHGAPQANLRTFYDAGLEHGQL
jgi:uroporphyrinogen-III decarboxylase